MSLHDDAVVVDCHNDLILMVERKRARGFPDHFREYWLPELRAGGVDVQVVPVFVEGDGAEVALRRTLTRTEAVHRIAEEHPDDIALCTTGEEIDAAVASGRIAFVIALEGCPGLGGNVDLVRTFFRLGVRMISFTHFGRTAFADGSAEDAAGGRLTHAGVAALAEMERLGIVTDVSHLSIAGTEHVLELATRPVIASHSSVRALADHHRNLTDTALKAIAATRGVIAINLFPWFIDLKEPTIDRAVDHIEHIAGVAGIDHVGIGPDFIREYFGDVYASEPDMTFEGLPVHFGIEGLSYTRELPNLTDALVGRGFSDDDVRRVLGANLLRVFREVMGRPA